MQKKFQIFAGIYWISKSLVKKVVFQKYVCVVRWPNCVCSISKTAENILLKTKLSEIIALRTTKNSYIKPKDIILIYYFVEMSVFMSEFVRY